MTIIVYLAVAKIYSVIFFSFHYIKCWMTIIINLFYLVYKVKFWSSNDIFKFSNKEFFMKFIILI